MLNIIPKPRKITFDESKRYSKGEDKITEKIDKKLSLGDEGYKLIINGRGISIKAETQRGIFYANKTLEQIKAQFGEEMPHCEIEDYPEYAYRGFMFDCARHFFSVEEIKKHLKIMSKLKLNVFHWHLTEDQGFRIEIKKYPKLNSIGSFRKETRGNGQAYGGYYTREEIRDVVKYASNLNINVLPEFDMPGHFSSLIASYPFLSCKAQPIEVKTSFGIFPDIACMGKQSTYQFIFDILDEIMELFPYDFIHLGGDEAIKSHVIECKDCLEIIRENEFKNVEELQAFFMSKIIDYVESKGKKVINWNDGVAPENTSRKVIVQHWHTGKESVKATLRADKGGNPIILSPFFHYYLDYPYGMTSLKKTYNYDLKVGGKEIENLWGLEAPIWTEYVDNNKTLEYMVYPRLIALADVAWAGEKVKDYADFELRLAQFYKILDKYSISYAKIDEVNPPFFKSKKQIIKFISHAAKGNIVKQQIVNIKAKKVINKFNKMLQSK